MKKDGHAYRLMAKAGVVWLVITACGYHFAKPKTFQCYEGNPGRAGLVWLSLTGETELSPATLNGQTNPEKQDIAADVASSLNDLFEFPEADSPKRDYILIAGVLVGYRAGESLRYAATAKPCGPPSLLKMPQTVDELSFPLQQPLSPSTQLQLWTPPQQIPFGNNFDVKH